jgi:hypothetical protein
LQAVFANSEHHGLIEAFRPMLTGATVFILRIIHGTRLLDSLCFEG